MKNSLNMNISKDLKTSNTKNLMLLAETLVQQHDLPDEDLRLLIDGRNEDDGRIRAFLKKEASECCARYYHEEVFLRGLIEFTNYCKNDCFYCGIRRSNPHADRYRLSFDEILSCCRQGYDLGFRTFVLQGGEDPYFTDERMEKIVSAIHAGYPDCAITLSLGERSEESYQRLFDAGADRYLLRHETASKCHYEKLHPEQMSFDNRMKCLETLRRIGYQTGCGFMVGSPYQTTADLVKDLRFLKTFQPHMVGIGPFLPQKDTPFGEMSAGSVELTLFLLSVIRLLLPKVLLPATTALGTAQSDGREEGLRSGANVIMPNLSPVGVRKKYALYDNKICTGEEAAECRGCLERRVTSAGFHIVSSRGDSLIGVE